MATYYVLKNTGLSGGVTRTWIVPAGKVAVAVRCYGGGSGPRSGYHYAGGGGAFAYNTISGGVAGTVFHYYAGVGGYNGNSAGHTLGNGGGGNTWFGATTFAAAICAANGANLSPGSSGPAPWGADYHGGAASTSIGSVKFSGGYGGNNNNTSNGGGGCAGPAGPGGHGGRGYNTKGLGGGGGANNGHAGYNASSSSQIGGAGGASGNGGAGGAGGSSGSAPTNPTNGGGGGGASYAAGGTPSTNGAPGTSGWVSGYGPGGGGGGFANGAMFGGGAGGASTANKTGGQGGIVVKCTDPPVILNAATGDFTLTGESVSVHAARVLPGGPATGHFTLTGEPVTFTPDISLRLPWLFTVTFGGSPHPPPLPIGGGGGGQGASDVLGAGYAGFNVFGQAVALTKALSLTAPTGSFALGGEAATLNIGHAFAVADGSFSLTGKSVALADVLSHALIASRGSFALTGENAGTKWGPKFAPAYGAFALTGGAATLSARSTFIEPATGGHDVLTGMPVALSVGRKFTAATGSFAFTGKPVSLSAHDPIKITGTPVTTGTVGATANFTVTAKAGIPPYRYAIFAGALPPGQSLNSATGAITGALTTAGTYSSIVIEATDAIGATATLAAYSITVSASTPASVIAAGLTSVWNLRTTAGLNSALTHTLPANASSLPAGWTIGTEGASKAVNITAAGSVSNWDFTGYEVWIKASVAVGFTNCKFAGAGLNIGLHVPNGVNPAVTISHCLFNGTGMTDAYGYSCILAGTAAMSVTFTQFLNAVQTHLWTSSTGTVSIEDNYFGAFAQGAPPQSHCDQLYIETGVPIVQNNLFDATPTAQTTGALTGCLHTGPIGAVAAGANVTGNIFCGITALGLLYACQALGSGGDDVTYTGNVIQKGSGSWVVTGATVIDGGGNLDFNTASPIAL